MRLALVAVVVLSLLAPVFGATSVRVGDPIESVYAGLIQVAGSDSSIAAQDVCGPTVADVEVHKSFYGPAGATIASSTAGEFDVVGAAHPFVALTYPADGDIPTAIYLSDANGRIVKILDPAVDDVPALCSLLPVAP